MIFSCPPASGRYVRLALLLALALLLGACSDDDNDAPRVAFSVTSYNAGLALNFVPYTRERLQANVDLLAGYDTDVLCLQEVWQADQVEAVSGAIAAQLPYIYTVPPEQVYADDAACTVEEVSPLADCAGTFCPELVGGELVSCTLTQCGAPLADLSPDCFNGVVATVGTPDLTVDLMVELVTRPSGLFTYDGSLGLILASRYPLENREFQDFIDDSSVIHRGALYADLRVGRYTYLVGCTHTAANLSATIDYPATGKHDSWQGENLFMQQELAAFAAAKAEGRPILMAGDFNCGLSNPANGVDAEWPENCQTWPDTGFLDPVAEQLPCSFCYSENLVLLLQSGSTDTLIDHVYAKDFRRQAEFRAERVLDDPVSIFSLQPPAELPDEDSPLLLHPSDHFGVRLEVRP